MFLFDTDHLSLAERDSIEAFNLGRRLATIPPGVVAVTIISYEEQMRGWLSEIAQAKTTDRQLQAYRKLREQIERYRVIPIVDFEANAAAEFDRLRKIPVRVGTMDLKIAAIALSMNAVLLTRNLRDFEKVPGLRIEDWTK